MPNYRGRFVWYELLTTDETDAKDFYSKVVEWDRQDSEGPQPYTLFTADGTPVAGMMALPDEAHRMGAPTHWLGYIAVEDVDREVARVQELGGEVNTSPRDIPGVGRFAVVRDPQAAVFALFRGTPQEPEQPVTMQGSGRVGWHELYAADWESAFSFYGEMFGWTKGEAMDMGAASIYQIFHLGGEMTGGMMNKPAEMPVPAWLYYFNVGDIDAALARVRENGGQIINGPMEVPGGGWILQAMDPQGGTFALLGRRGQLQ